MKTIQLVPPSSVYLDTSVMEFKTITVFAEAPF